MASAIEQGRGQSHLVILPSGHRAIGIALLGHLIEPLSHLVIAQRQWPNDEMAK
jgi:hypothetical protein